MDEVGVDAERGARRAATERFADDVREDELLAAQLGIQGVPFFVFDRRLGVSGAQPPECSCRPYSGRWDEAVTLPA